MRILFACVAALLAGLEALADTNQVVDPSVDTVAKRYIDTTPIVGFGVTVVRKGSVVHC
jgi:hypothetical protein